MTLWAYAKLSLVAGGRSFGLCAGWLAADSDGTPSFPNL